MLEKAREFLVDYIRKRSRDDEGSRNSESCVEMTDDKMKELDEQRQDNSRKQRRIGDVENAEDITGDEGDTPGDLCEDHRCARCPDVPFTDKEVPSAQVDVKVSLAQSLA
eukprot:403411-Prorocentrum_minimum.AAC.1